MTNSISPHYYQDVGGALQIDSLTYVERQADQELYESLKYHNYPCYVLAPRQFGKSSLMVKTAHRLTQEEFLCIQINLQGFGEALSEASLYLSLLHAICDKINEWAKPSEINWTEKLREFWYNSPELPPTFRFKSFMKEVLQSLEVPKIIIFLDEIQTLIYWKLQNSFLGLIKSLLTEEGLNTLTFVLLGVAKPEDLLSDAAFAFNQAKAIELTYLSGDCQPLVKGLEGIYDNPQSLLKAILSWTGGQPFLTQVLCNLVMRHRESINASIQIDQDIGDLVKREIIEDWRRNDKSSHFRSIEDWFILGYTQYSEKIAALNLYRQLLNNTQIPFRGHQSEQINLILSGLVIQSNNHLQVANQIYREIFNLNWIDKTQTFLVNSQGEFMASTKILNREVYILVDQSATMDRKDRGKSKTRWDSLAELLEGDIKKLLRETNGRKICEKVHLYLFSRDRVGRRFEIPPADLYSNIFEENFPDSNTYIAPTLKHCLDHWMNGARNQGKNAFIIIYTDGMLDDQLEFEKLIKETCGKLNNEEELKIVMIGIGDDVEADPTPFLNLDFNLNHNKYNIFGFDLAKEIEDISDLLSRQLESDPNDPETQVPKWVKDKHRDWYQKFLDYSKSKKQ
ncbi:AAA-like domain-containing protein [Planktothrix mougeotii]|uniref:AAA-like domain-containing protein n=1 Tax=Planktothrix mougeotii LEGE 06226 TaxID=1828728 RepID=A0ABR9UJ45_9CYAN|nr:AAA-like domain-containing protein [Planktothrix mougeotii]MBE9146498.1 AAA-like domain-containing protein [Planktothrix mougeotii LEGE 06226]